MRFLADENLSVPSIRQLREAGLDVEAIGERSPGIPDEEVLAHARTAEQVLITFDRDFGELVYRREAAVPMGIIYLRVPQTDPAAAARAVLQLLEVPGIVLPGRFTFVESDKVRQRLLPSDRQDRNTGSSA